VVTGMGPDKRGHMYKQEIISSVDYYKGSTLKSLSMAQRYSGQASVSDLADMRFLYSTCLANLVSLTEYLGDASVPYSTEFRAALETNFVFEDAPDGAQNYGYLRGIRNMVVHRGYDVSTQGHVVENRLSFVLPSQALSISGKTAYIAYERYLPALLDSSIAKLDSIISLHIETFISQLPDPTEAEMEQEIRDILAQTDSVMPNEARQTFLELLDTHGISGLMKMRNN
jgi:hypothetical protein